MNLPVVANPDRALIAEVAMDIGKEAVSHLRTMYPEAFHTLGRSGQLSLRNHIHNQIMAALDTVDAGEIRNWLDDRKARRKQAHRFYDGIRKNEAPSP